MKTAIHPPVGAVTACAKCGECCKRYAISVLPHERTREAAFFKLSEKEFTHIYTRLLVQIVPFSSSDHPLSLHSSMVPKLLWEKLQTAGLEQNHVMILPMLGFRKKEYCVFFNPETFGCSMHAVKPAQCTLFPFTSINENEDYSKAYDFCELSKITSPTKYTAIEQRGQRLNMKKYFDAVAKKGLLGVWKNLPSEGDVVFNGKKIGEITLSELNKMLSVASTKVVKA